MAVRLYQFAISHFCEKSRWALEYKGIQYQPVYLLPGSHIKTIKALAGTSSVPVLEHDQEVVQGSEQITDYLDRTFPDNPLTPENEDERAQALAWERRLDEEAGPAVRCYCYHHLLQRPKVVTPLLTAQTPFYNRFLVRLAFSRIDEVMRNWMKINEKTAAQSMETMTAVLQDLAEAYQSGPYLVGDRFSRADLTAAALFAPLFQPAGYPVPWPKPERLPQAMQQWLESQQSALAPLIAQYERHR